MAFLQNMPSRSVMFDVYASLSGAMMLLRSTYNLIPLQIREFLWSVIQKCYPTNRSRSTVIFEIKENFGMERSLLFDAAKVYLTKDPSACLKRVEVAKVRSRRNISVGICTGGGHHEHEVIVNDTFRDIKVTWSLVRSKPQSNNSRDDPSITSSARCYFELSFDSQNREEVLSAYLQHVLDTSASLTQKDKDLKLFTHPSSIRYDGNWTSTSLQHPASFDTIAMDPDLKRSIIADLELYQSGKEYYQRIGKAWKRGYLFHGPPGTGKSSLIAAVAKFLKYDVYYLDLSGISSNTELRNVLLRISPKSILVIEDVDCHEEVHARSESVEIKDKDDKKMKKHSTCNLSGILNGIDGLWSGSGEERIIIFTTNHKNKIDPALLRPGRIDRQFELSYLNPSAFSVLAEIYFGVLDQEHPMLVEIKSLLEHIKVTPASVAEIFLENRKVDDALGGVLNFLKLKMEEVNGGHNEGAGSGSAAKAVAP